MAHPTPKAESNTLAAALAAEAKAGPKSQSPKFEPDALHRVPLELLDDNPWQPRSSMDERELTELVDAIRAQGLIQSIAARPHSNGRFTIVAGHRRVAAFKRLRDAAATETERAKYATIPATMKVALDESQLAAQAYMENVSRAALTPLDEAKALEAMVEKGLAKTNDELAALVQQPAIRIRRIRRLSSAPPSIRAAISTGVLVVVGSDEAGKEKKELRRLDLLTAHTFIRVFEHHKAAAPAKADARTEAAVRRALLEGWNLRRCEKFAQDLVDGRPEAAEAPMSSAPVEPVFTCTPKKLTIDLARLKTASAEARAALKQALEEVLGWATPARSHQ